MTEGQAGLWWKELWQEMSESRADVGLEIRQESWERVWTAGELWIGKAANEQPAQQVHNVAVQFSIFISPFPPP